MNTNFMNNENTNLFPINHELETEITEEEQKNKTGKGNDNDDNQWEQYFPSSQVGGGGINVGIIDDDNKVHQEDQEEVGQIVVTIQLKEGQYSQEKLIAELSIINEQEKSQIQLILTLNKNQQILKSLASSPSPSTSASTSFTSLQMLNLAHNNLTTIEPISQISLPNLTTLLLFENLIYGVKTMKKAMMPRLKVLNIVENRVVSLDGISSGFFCDLEQIWAYDNKIQEAMEILKLKKGISASSLGEPDFHYPLQVMMVARCSSYTPLEVAIQF